MIGSGAMRADRTGYLPHRRFIIGFIVVVGLALAMRFGFAAMVCRQLTPEAFRDVHGDTNGYLKLSRTISEHKRYAPATAIRSKYPELIARDRLRALARPPGYPIFLAIHQWCGFDLRSDARPIVWTQAILSAGLAGIVFALGCSIFGHLSGGFVAGLFAAVSPTAIACASLATPDSLFAVSATAGFAAYVGVACNAQTTRTRIGLAVLCGVMYSVAVALKPAILYWPAIAIPALLVLRRFRIAAFRDAAIAFGPMLLVVVTWANANADREGMRTYSTIALKNVSSDVVVRAKLESTLGRLPLETEYKAAARLREANDRKIFLNPEFDPRAYCEQLAEDSRATARQFPGDFARILWANFREQVTSGWYWLDNQLPLEFVGSSTVVWIYGHTDHRNMQVVWWTCVIAAIPICVVARDRRPLKPLILCAFAFLYIAAGTATTHGEGSRLMMAAEPMELLLITGTLCHVAHAVRRVCGFGRHASLRSDRSDKAVLTDAI